MRLRQVAIAAACSFVLLGGASAAYLVGAGHSITVLALVICIITAVPLLQARELDLFSPWNYMLYFVLLNVLIRQIFVDFEITDDPWLLDYIFYRGQPREFMVESTAILLFGFLFLTLGYLSLRTRPVVLPHAVFHSDQYDARRYKRAVILMLLASSIAFILFVKYTFADVGEIALQTISRHRGLSTDITEYRAYGYLRLLIGLSSLVVYLAYMRLKMESRDKAFYRAALGVGLLISVSMAIYSQSRAALLFVFLNIIFVKYYLDNRRFPWTGVMIAVPFLLAIFVGISSLRGASGVDLTARITPATVIAPIVLNNGGIDAGKTGHIINYTTDSQDYKFGATLVQFIIAAVPRQFWLNKPPNLDTYIGEKIYGAETFGASAVPPGFFAEMFMNLWYAGIVIGALVLGVAMKAIQNILTANRRNPNFVVFYVIALQSFGMSVLASGFSSTVVGCLMSSVPLLVAMNYITIKKPRSPITPHSPSHSAKPAT